MKLQIRRLLQTKIFLIVVLILIGTFLRVYNIEQRTPFDADQEWMALRSRDLLRGDLALIGPVTSVGSFSIGPGFIYLNSLISLVTAGDPVSGAYLSVFVGILTLIAFYLFCKYFVSEELGLLTLILTSFSVFLTAWDQSPWTPSLFYLAQVIILSGAYMVSLKKDLGWLILSIGVVLGFQSHIGVVLSIISIFIYLFITGSRLPNKKYALLSLLILFFGFLPNIVFDLANNYANLHRFKGIFSGGEYNYLPFSKVTGAMAYSSATILYPRQVNIFDSFIVRIILAASIASGVSLLFDKRLKKVSLLLLITAILPPALFYIQQGKFSEYYIMMSIPSLILLTSLLIYKFKINKIIFYGLITMAIILNLQKWTKLDRKLSLHHKKQVVSRIVQMGGEKDYGVSLSIEHGMQFGYNYIFEYYKAKPNIPPLKDQKKIFTIVVPNGFDGIHGFEDYGGIGLLWQGI